MLLTFLLAYERDIIMFLAGAALMSVFFSACEPFTRHYKGWRHERMWTYRDNEGRLVRVQEEHPAELEAAIEYMEQVHRKAKEGLNATNARNDATGD